ncbi:helix-turn-helix transcriptional regulator [Myceligenerans salitolerans]|uniref:Response regulator transcription factor n=1 Tax=Myceligenerans salitolerans TaxID=1230528 RepID=A0ABS3IA17_9MICO|nr:LuxR C-terminal-related transcriptional regulator [Myceligenerans salitolerans]MBO0609840.1 response regulator transcription factor [Myceligenerans salitolerans]
MTTFGKVAVALWTSGRVSDEGAEMWFDEHPRFVCLPFRERSDAQVLLFLAPQAAERALAAMNAPAGALTLPSVLVTDGPLTPRQVSRATARGMARFLDHGMTTMSEVAEALIAAEADAEAREAKSRPNPRGGQARPPAGDDHLATGFSPREIEVLRLLAQGSRIAEISARLNYSERTIKNIVHGVVHRFGFRNRTQAVAYGVRIGAL